MPDTENLNEAADSGLLQPRLVRGGVLTILRVYNNGDRLKQTLPHDQAMAEIEYSKANRWGCALFIGSECVQTGYLGEERCAAISAEISSANVEVARESGEKRS